MKSNLTYYALNYFKTYIDKQSAVVVLCMSMGNSNRISRINPL